MESMLKPNGKSSIEALTDFRFPLEDLGEETDMPPTQIDRLIEAMERRAEEDRRAREEDRRQRQDESRILLAAISNNGNSRKPPAWASLALSAVALLGAGSVWLTNSGASVGKYVNNQQIQDEKISRLESENDKLKGRLDKLRDLYMVQFGADPEDPNTKPAKRR